MPDFPHEAARRLDFSPSPSPSPPRSLSRPPRPPPRGPALPSIAEDPEEQTAETSAPPSSPTPPHPLCAPSEALSYAMCLIRHTSPLLGYVSPSPPLVRASPAPSPSPSPFQQQEAIPAAALQLQQQAWAAAAVQQQPQQLRLYTVEGKSAGYNARWEELHPASQVLLLQIENKMREYRDECEQLDQCSRFSDSSLSNKGFELDASQNTQEIGWISTIMDREKASIQSLVTVVNEMMWNTDFAIRSYVKLRPRFVHRGAGIANAGCANRAGSAGALTDFNQPVAMAPFLHCYSGAARRPSTFMQHTVARLEKNLGELCKWIEELEQLVQMKNDKASSDHLESLPKVMSNVHDYFIHVASKVENVHQYAESMRTQYLNDRRHRGNWSDPFLEANRREAAKQEATARRVHPTLHLLPPVQPTTLVAEPMMTSQSQLQQSSFPTVAIFSSAFPTLSTPPSVLPTSSSRTCPSPLTDPFGSSGSVLQPTPFGSASTLPLGSTPATYACETNIPSSASLSAVGGTSLFSTPPGGVPTARRSNRTSRGRLPQTMRWMCD